MDCTGSDQNRFHNEYKKGDIVWFHSIVDGEHLYLVGCCLTKNWLKRGRNMSLAAHLPPRLNSKHTGLQRSLGIKFRGYELDIAPLLEFVPSNPTAANYNGQNFQTIRRLSISDQQLIQDEWDIWME